MDHGTQRAREHLRVSADRSKRQRSIADQHSDNERAAETYGWTLGEPYNDGVVSASAFSDKPREGFDQLMDDLTADTFNAEILIWWANDRATREMDEAAPLVTLCKKRGVQIYVTSHDRLYDPAKPRDRRSLLEDAIDAEWYSAKLSDAVTRAKKADAASGKPNGGHVAYGYMAVGQRHDLRWEIEPQEAQVIREVADAILSGKSVRSEADRLNRYGPKPRNTDRWSITKLKRVLTNPAIAGKRRYYGEIVGEAQWRPILSEEKWQEVCDALKGRAKEGRKRPKSLLGGLLLCGRSNGEPCGSPMVAEHENRYRCDRLRGGCGRVIIARKPLDQYVMDETVKYAAKRHPPEPDEEEAPNPRIAEIEDEIAKWTRKIEEADRAYESDLISGAEYFPRLGRYRDGINELKREQARLTSHRKKPRKRRPATPEEDKELDRKIRDDIKRLLEEWPPELRNLQWLPSTDSLREFISPYVAKVVVKPTPVRGRWKFDSSRVEIYAHNGDRIA